MPVSLSADGASISEDFSEAKEKAQKAHVNNPKALDGGLYFHARHIDYETEDALCFPKAKGGGLWLPKSKVHVLKSGLGRVDVWVTENFVRQTDKPYGKVLGPDVPTSSLPKPTEELGAPSTITEGLSAKFSGKKYECSPEFHETEKALGLPRTDEDDYVWIPKSQCHAVERRSKLTIWVKDWLVTKKPGLNYLKPS